MTCQLQQQLTLACVLIMSLCQIVSGRCENNVILSVMYAHAIIIAGFRCTCYGLNWPRQPPPGYHYETMAQIQRRYPRNSYTIMPYWMAAANGKLLGNNQGSIQGARNLPQKGGAPKKNNASPKKTANKKPPKKPPKSEESDDDLSGNNKPPKQQTPTANSTATAPPAAPTDSTATPTTTETPAVLVKKRKKRDFFGTDSQVLHDNSAVILALMVDAGLDGRARMFVKNGGTVNGDGTAAVGAIKAHDNNNDGDYGTNDASAMAKSSDGASQTETGRLAAERDGRIIIDVSTDVENSMAIAAPYLPVINTVAEHIVPGVTPYQVLLIAANVAYITSIVNCKNRHRNHVNLLIDVVPRTTALNPRVPARINGHCEIDNASNSSYNKFKNIFQYLYERVCNLLNSPEVSTTESNITEIDGTNNLNDNHYCINENAQYYHVDNGKSFERIEKAELSRIDEVRFKQLLLDSNDIQPIFTKMSGKQLVQYFNGLNLQLQEPSVDIRQFFQMLVNTMMNFDKNVADEDIQTLIATLSNVTNFFIINAILQ